MELTTIKQVLDDEALTGTTIAAAGWVRTFRNDRFIALNDGSTIRNPQCVIDQEKVGPEAQTRTKGRSGANCFLPVDPYFEGGIASYIR